MFFMNGLYNERTGETYHHLRGKVPTDCLLFLPLLDDIPRDLDNIIERAVQTNRSLGMQVYPIDPSQVALILIRLVEANYAFLYGNLSFPMPSPVPIEEG